MADAWLCDVGIRVTDLDRSIAFYSKILDLVVLKRASDEDSAYVLLKDNDRVSESSSTGTTSQARSGPRS